MLAHYYHQVSCPLWANGIALSYGNQNTRRRCRDGKSCNQACDQVRGQDEVTAHMAMADSRVPLSGRIFSLTLVF